MTKKTQQTKPFKVASISSNRNSFGLQGVILVAKDGEAFEVGASYLHAVNKGDVVLVPLIDEHDLNFAYLGFEIPTYLPQAPPDVVAEVWRSATDEQLEPLA